MREMRIPEPVAAAEQIRIIWKKRHPRTSGTLASIAARNLAEFTYMP